jgi:hypothetical protein
VNQRSSVVILSSIIIMFCLGAELAILFLGYPATIPEIIVGRVLGTLDAAAMLVLSYHYGSSAGSARKSELLAQERA